MKHLTFADKSLLVGDEAADLLVEYAKVLGQQRAADSIELRAIGSDGDDVVATFLLNAASSLIAETTTSHLPEPDNAKAEEYMHARILHLRARLGSFEDIAGEGVWNGPVAD